MIGRYQSAFDKKRRMYLPEAVIEHTVGYNDLVFIASQVELFDTSCLLVCNNTERSRLVRILGEGADDPFEVTRALCGSSGYACIGLDEKGKYIRLFDDSLLRRLGIPKGGMVTAFTNEQRLFVVKREDEKQFERGCTVRA